MIPLLIAALAVATADPSAAPSATPAPVTTPNPLASYKPIPCSTLVRAAHLEGKSITADSLGKVFAQALYAHGVRPGGKIPSWSVAQAELDFNSCFATTKAAK